MHLVWLTTWDWIPHKGSSLGKADSPSLITHPLPVAFRLGVRPCGIPGPHWLSVGAIVLEILDRDLQCWESTGAALPPWRYSRRRASDSCSLPSPLPQCSLVLWMKQLVLGDLWSAVLCSWTSCVFLQLFLSAVSQSFFAEGWELHLPSRGSMGTWVVSFHDQGSWFFQECCPQHAVLKPDSVHRPF